MHLHFWCWLISCTESKFLFLVLVVLDVCAEEKTEENEWKKPEPPVWLNQ